MNYFSSSKEYKNLKWIAAFFLILELSLKPILKYYEWHQYGFRVNFSIIFSALTLLALTDVIIKLSVKKFKVNLNLYSFLPVFSLCLIGSIMLVSYPRIMSFPIQNIQEYFLEYLSSAFISSFMFFLSGFFILNLIQKSTMKRVFLFFWLLYSTVILINTNFEQNIFQSTIEILLINPNYLMMADAYVLLSFILISGIKGISLRVLTIIFSTFCLFLLKSRASLYTFVVLNIIVLVIHERRVLWFGLLLFLGSFFFFDWSQFLRLNADNRMFRLLTFGLDRSSQERGDIFLTGLNSIKENWFLGDYMGDVLYRMKPGKYIHNVLSFWRQFGLLPFLLITFNLIYIYFKLFVLFIRKKWNSKIEFTFFYSIYCLLLILFARSFVFSEFWIVFSLIPSLIYAHTNKEKSH